MGSVAGLTGVMVKSFDFEFLQILGTVFDQCVLLSHAEGFGQPLVCTVH